MYEGFETRKVTVDGLALNVTTGGGGPPLLMLHGYPETRLCWHRVAPLLSRRFTLVLPDLPGYGDSEGPPADGGRHNQSKRETARRMVGLMQALGHERFRLAGHDRGGRVAYRLALDHPERVERLVLLDIVPTGTMWERMRAEQAHKAFHWLFLAQPAPYPETVIAADPDGFIGPLLDRWTGRPGGLDPAARAAYIAQYRRRSVVEASCEDYRAGYGPDRAHDEADRQAGRRIAAPTLVLWAKRYLGDPGTTWNDWCADVRTQGIDSGHFLAEEEPEATAEALTGFFAG